MASEDTSSAVSIVFWFPFSHAVSIKNFAVTPHGLSDWHIEVPARPRILIICLRGSFFLWFHLKRSSSWGRGWLGRCAGDFSRHIQPQAMREMASRPVARHSEIRL